jgi:hypothetical protein
MLRYFLKQFICIDTKYIWICTKQRTKIMGVEESGDEVNQEDERTTCNQQMRGGGEMGRWKLNLVGCRSI